MDEGSSQRFGPRCWKVAAGSDPTAQQGTVATRRGNDWTQMLNLKGLENLSRKSSYLIHLNQLLIHNMSHFTSELLMVIHEVHVLIYQVLALNLWLVAFVRGFGFRLGVSGWDRQLRHTYLIVHIRQFVSDSSLQSGGWAGWSARGDKVIWGNFVGVFWHGKWAVFVDLFLVSVWGSRHLKTCLCLNPILSANPCTSL